MKIDSPNPNMGQLSGVPAPQDRVELSRTGQAQETEKTGAAGSDGARSRAAAAGAGTDSAQISNLGQSLRLQTEDTPERTAYLARLQEQVDAGNYDPAPADIARSIMDDLLKP